MRGLFRKKPSEEFPLRLCQLAVRGITCRIRSANYLNVMMLAVHL